MSNDTWYEASKYRPMYGNWIFSWYMDEQKPILVKYLSDASNWRSNPHFPIWRYAFEDPGILPIKLEET
jgi:hypothetical protein